ncbi:MAG: DUF362 domain-containing protein [Nanoarchaeota archaeon]|nr:DUF362 domain-containing protein [Nanoarchaeota archaeon]MBU1004633.1 DUF362 domain-containing protein [Nanoarchaeota archaeon]MBU1946187.1 DUF362 domain-containing protein [Nanoarchaeota archaeon]
MTKNIRWICEKCNKKWIHPVDTCIYCSGKMKKQIGTTLKVIGMTKVFTPSPPHPIIPYNVIMLEDEHGNRMPKKVMKDYSLGDSYLDVADSSDNAVSVVKIKYDFYEAVKEAIELIGDVKVDAATKILIKPNLSIPGYAYIGICTNPKVLDALIEYIIEKGAKAENITIAEQSFFVPLEKAASKSGVINVIKKFGVKYADISLTEFETVNAREFSFEVSKIVKQFDLIFNVPVIKTDMILGIDGAFENLTRFLSKKTFTELAKDPTKAVNALALLPSILSKFITIGDASIGMQGNGPAENGEPGFFNLIFCSRNPVCHDKIVQEVFCLRKLPYVELAGKLGAGAYEMSKIKVIGSELESLRRDIKQPIGSRLIKKD